MPRKPVKVPAYCHHKASGQAVVRIDGRDCYLGKFGSPQSHQEYERRIAEWRLQREPRKDSGVREGRPTWNLTVAQLIRRYKVFAEGYYVRGARPTKELTEMKYALRPVRQLYGNTLAREFGPLALKAVRQHLVDADLSRGVVNRRINRVRRFFKWAVGEEFVPPGVLEGLRAVRGLDYGRTSARETDPIRPVPDQWVDATLPFLSPQVAAMVRLQRISGMRPCEVVAMRATDIDMSDDVWIYEPEEHKNRWRGHRRMIPLGPRAQEIVRPFLKLNTSAFLFSPQDAEAWRNSVRRDARKSPMTPSQSRRRTKPRPKRPKGERYDADSYRRAITYGIKKANKSREGEPEIPHWFPLQLRHSRATEVRKSFGLEAAQVSLGHARADVTEVYAEKNLALAIEVASRTG